MYDRPESIVKKVFVAGEIVVSRERTTVDDCQRSAAVLIVQLASVGVRLSRIVVHWPYTLKEVLKGFPQRTDPFC